jgi:hypothetical protein
VKAPVIIATDNSLPPASVSTVSILVSVLYEKVPLPPLGVMVFAVGLKG